MFFSLSVNDDLAPKTRANTLRIAETCGLDQWPVLHYGILFDLQLSSLFFSIAMVTSLLWAVNMGGKPYMLNIFDILLSKYS